jgi:hypothetical protein
VWWLCACDCERVTVCLIVRVTQGMLPLHYAVNDVRSMRIILDAMQVFEPLTLSVTNRSHPTALSRTVSDGEQGRERGDADRRARQSRPHAVVLRSASRTVCCDVCSVMCCAVIERVTCRCVAGARRQRGLRATAGMCSVVCARVCCVMVCVCACV